MIIAFCRKTQWPSFQSSRGSSPPTHCARLACWKNVTINSSLSARSQCPKNVTGINRWLSSRRSLGNSRNPGILSIATHLPSVLDPVILPPTWVTVIVQSVMINQWKRSKVWWHYSPIYPKLLSQQYVITRLTKGQAGTPHCTPFPYVAAYPRPKTYLLKWSSGLVGLILFPAQLSKLIWGELSWTGGHEASQGAQGRANQSRMSPHSNSILFTMGRLPGKVIFIGRLEEKRVKMGVKWVHFLAECCSGACSQSLLSPPPCSGYGPQGENHWAVRIRVRIRYAVKTLGPLSTN